jgi:hypothetical protein
VADLSALGLGKLVRLLASDKPGEIVAAAYAIVRLLTKNGADIHALADHIEHTNGKRILEDDMQRIFRAGYEKGVHDAEERLHDDDGFRDLNGLPSWHRMARFCQRHSDHLRANERKFVNDMAARTTWREPTDKQGKWLQSIYFKLGGK